MLLEFISPVLIFGEVGKDLEHVFLRAASKPEKSARMHTAARTDLPCAIDLVRIGIIQKLHQPVQDFLVKLVRFVDRQGHHRLQIDRPIQQRS